MSEWPRRRALSVTTAALALGIAALSAIADGDAGPCPYTVIEAGAAAVCGGFQLNKALNPRGLNNLGHWAGYRFQCGETDDKTMAIRWSPEAGVVALPVPAGTTASNASAINDLGTVVGIRSGVSSGQSHGDWACIWLNNGQFIEIPPLGGGSHSVANAVSNSNIVVGSRRTLGTAAAWYAFLWQSGKVTDIDPAPLGFDSASAYDVSDSGFIVGQLGSDAVPGGRGFRWKDGRIEILEPLHGGSVSIAFAVNSSGTVVGLSRQNPTGGGGPVWPTVWGPDGVATEYPVLPGYASGSCRKINDAGVVTGQSSGPIRPGLPSTLQVVWHDGVPYGIRSLIDAPNPMQFLTAWDLNNPGQIVGQGTVPPTGSGGVWVLNPTGSIADLDRDCIVDGADLSLLLAAWGAISDPSADLNHDGKVDGADLGLLLGAWTGGG